MAQAALDYRLVELVRHLPHVFEANGATSTGMSHQAMRDIPAESITVKALLVLKEVIAGKRPFSLLPWRMICFGARIKRFEVEVAA